jgi:hypothetical protein
VYVSSGEKSFVVVVVMKEGKQRDDFDRCEAHEAISTLGLNS